MIRPEFWRDKRVFLTGHTGFKGTWTSLLLARLGAHVTGYSLSPETSPSLFELSGGANIVAAHIVADIRDQATLTSAMRQAKPEVVIHMAAQSLVRRSYRNPTETFDVNVMGTAHVLEAIRATPEARAGIIVTTDKVYDLSGDTSPRKETDPLGGHDPYSASKAAAEILTQSWRQSFFVGQADASPANIATVRSGNVIGGGDWSQDRIVTDLVASLSAGREVELRYPDSVRPWLYVLDTLTGYLMLAERLHGGTRAFAEAWNFGPLAGEEMRVRDVVSLFAQEWGGRGGWRQAAGSQPAEAPLLRLDPGKAVDQLGWRPSLGQAEAIRETAAWYRAFLTQQADATNLCRAGVERHLSRIEQASPAAF
ncbi:CDP-glucose 4,6-dehydratase [Bosea sp. AK1]|uniref:CDP-glucose 4,6-dehydratase n=1 Tax=Bosea sp. AK1 TaxID=2587160 RepID=UPI00116B121D|nr:CDP-glucose 4,6-dehydratase [Bosea sp. AK1]TQI75487.1 CDP-glucose 4,6-dehydratase [Bosea sp. AK1]